LSCLHERSQEEQEQVKETETRNTSRQEKEEQSGFKFGFLLFTVSMLTRVNYV